MSALATWWHARSLREQRLLLVMFALLALVLGWLLVVRPLGDALDDARRRHGEAIVALAEARARAPAARAAAARPAVPLPLDALVRRSAGEAGFAGARIAARGPTGAQVVIEAATPQALFGWVRRLESLGVEVASLRARTNADRTLFVEAAFRAGPRR